MTFYTARVGQNANLFPDILALYISQGARIADVTYGPGAFWKLVNAPDYKIYTSDIEYGRGKIVADFQHLPYSFESMDALVLDPPYLYIGGFKTLRSSYDNLYLNKNRAIQQGIYGVKAVDQLFYRGMVEAYRVLKNKGILIVKCMDQVMSGQQALQHITIINFGYELGYKVEDLFVLVAKSPPINRWKHQVHARHNHSYFVILRKWNGLKKCK